MVRTEVGQYPLQFGLLIKLWPIMHMKYNVLLPTLDFNVCSPY